MDESTRSGRAASVPGLRGSAEDLNTQHQLGQWPSEAAALTLSDYVDRVDLAPVTVERRDERVARGKPEIGDVSLSLTQEGNEIILLLSDDGAGLDYERIRARAIAAGLLAADQDAGHEELC